jgi:hypothetical protein
MRATISQERKIIISASVLSARPLAEEKGRTIPGSQEAIVASKCPHQATHDNDKLAARMEVGARAVVVILQKPKV